MSHIAYHDVVIEWWDGESYKVVIAVTEVLPEPLPEDDDGIAYWSTEEPYVGMPVGEAKVVAV